MKQMMMSRSNLMCNSHGGLEVPDCIHQGSKTSAGKIGYVVLDEADKMLSLGFKPQLDQIWKRMLNGMTIDNDGSPDGVGIRPQV